MRATLREWRQSDAASLARYADNPKIFANLRDAFPSPYTERDAERFIEMCLEADADSIFRAVDVDGEAVGSISAVRGKDVYRRSAELGYWLAEPYWGKGIMTSAVQEICEQAFSELDIVRIFAEPYAYNTASRCVLEKAGFTLEGVLKNAAYKCGKLVDACIYALLK